jgi:hypothetical protein
MAGAVIKGSMCSNIFVQELLPAFEMFLGHYLVTWNGSDHKDLIFKLLGFIKPASFDGMVTWMYMAMMRCLD